MHLRQLNNHGKAHKSSSGDYHGNKGDVGQPVLYIFICVFYACLFFYNFFLCYIDEEHQIRKLENAFTT